MLGKSYRKNKPSFSGIFQLTTSSMFSVFTCPKQSSHARLI